jgi:methyl-accepting chemotaxis protein
MNTKILIVGILILLALAAGVVFYLPSLGIFSSKQDNGQDMLIKAEVETAISMLQGIYDRQQAGELTLDQAKALGADLLRGLSYGADGYFWADTVEGVNVVLYGRTDVEGRNRLEDKDEKGTYYIKELIQAAQAGGGYVEYWFTKKGGTVAQPKRSYTLLFEPFGWEVGTGYYK